MNCLVLEAASVVADAHAELSIGPVKSHGARRRTRMFHHVSQRLSHYAEGDDLGGGRKVVERSGHCELKVESAVEVLCSEAECRLEAVVQRRWPEAIDHCSDFGGADLQIVVQRSKDIPRRDLDGSRAQDGGR